MRLIDDDQGDSRLAAQDSRVQLEASDAQPGHPGRHSPVGLEADLRLPARARGLVIFAHGSGSSRFSPRNRAVAEALVEAGFATLLLDLLTEAEAPQRANVFDVELLSERSLDALAWARAEPELQGLPIGLFGASTGAAAAISAAASRPGQVGAVVSRGGRPDLAGRALERIRVPTLLIVGGADPIVLELNQQALARLRGPKELQIVPGASHLFPERGALEAVMTHAS
ncbi:MAG: dienelactone hydrolase family protein, partial [Alphaproteobacteria bacterium]|nr:dienelactone hydrolase family protein [Alphaproteobacteria bacterium]